MMALKLIVLSALFILGIQVSFVHSNPKGYVGCFADSSRNRALSYFTGLLSTVASCQARCRAAKWRYTGMQAMFQCYCGTTYNKYGRSRKCNIQCVSGGGTCGKAYVNSVYLSYGNEIVYHQPRGFYGCFRDRKARALRYWAGHVSSIPECIGKCRMVYYQPFAGLQNGRDCWCGKHYGKYGRAYNCKMKCPIGLVCGGSYSNSVYRVYGVPLDPKPPKGYLGCFKENFHARAFPMWIKEVESVRECIMICYDRKMPYVGIHFGNGCYCGRNYARYGRTTNCYKRCKTGEICGGWLRNSVYRVYDAVNTSPPRGHLGCYRENPHRRALPIFAGDVVSVRECILRCQAKRQRYAGLHFGKGCVCGNNYAKYGKRNNCNVRCTTGEICGGWLSNTVYKV